MPLDGYLDIDITDDTIEFTFTVENVGAEPVDLEFRSGNIADITVYDEGVEVWRWSEGQMFTQAIQTETLASGETLTREITWDDPSPGKYTAEASLEATTATLVEPAVFEVH